ncbi:hypothetical protein BU17DRAFT_50227 [Hysterangium stoloniferum]|nr:hypothetical protein BU17DRAFT_50227 [Hysterangium stoloniferum]
MSIFASLSGINYKLTASLVKIKGARWCLQTNQTVSIQLEQDDRQPEVSNILIVSIIDVPLSVPSSSYSENPEGTRCECKAPPEGKTGRNLIVCIDGTSNQFGKKNTNVIELYSQLVKDDGTQLTYYNSGVGTYAKPSWKSWSYLKQVVNNKIDLAIAWNFEKIVISAYRWLADNYQDGDKIYLFGFSRGAYQVRVLAGMIDKVGLIYKGNEEQIPFAYELYADPRSDGTTRPKPLNLAKRFKDTFSKKGVQVHFIGVWDTVSSIGIVRGRNLPGTVKLDHTCYFRHALALDERRVKFLPEYACGGVMVDESKSQQRQKIPHIKEVWFPGTHSDIHPSFLWMSFEAVWAGLKLDRSNVAWKWDELGSMRESLTLPWQILEYLPMKQLSYQSADSVTSWYAHAVNMR